ncbi:MAG TPA: hypothetical protein VE242_04355, partial [Chthoniobacterales bacterium]|nr:hypothetical protein [Chthoniobacterales bacterium]
MGAPIALILVSDKGLCNSFQVSERDAYGLSAIRQHRSSAHSYGRYVKPCSVVQQIAPISPARDGLKFRERTFNRQRIDWLPIHQIFVPVDVQKRSSPFTPLPHHIFSQLGVSRLYVRFSGVKHFAILGFLALASCATGYQPESISGGFSDYMTA